jgi:uncharacterized protein YuzE
VRITFDRTANAAYIYLTNIGPGEAVRQHLVDVPRVSGEPPFRGDIILDFNAKGRFTGIEVLEATKVLPYEFLDHAERI